jgi:hypothetical protein
MDPLSTIAGTSTISSICVKVLVCFSEYLEEIRGVPQYVDQLTSELSAVNAGLKQLKVMTTAWSNDELVRRWAGDSTLMLDNCGETFTQIESSVND